MGNRPEYCGDGCQSQFSYQGHCVSRAAAATSTAPRSSQQAFVPLSTEGKEKRCGPQYGNQKCKFGVCCSLQGYCGKGSDYCAVPGNCLQGYGWCDNLETPFGYNQTLDKRPLSKSKQLKTPIDRCSKPRTLALTFDDGPTNYTEAILDALKAAKPPGRATFFVSGITNGKGQLDKEWAKVVRRMMAEGHQVASHTWSHPHLNNLTTDERRIELAKNERAIANILGRYPSFVRAPYLQCNQECQKDMKRFGYYLVNWERDSEDWRVETPLRQMIEKFDNNFAASQAIKDGSMFYIQHDTHDKALPFVLHALDTIKQQSGWSAVPLVECLGHKLDFAYRFPDWIDPLDVVPHGCLVSDSKDFCVNIHPFSHKSDCKTAVNKLASQSAKCLGSSTAACQQSKNIRNQLESFCHRCGTEELPCELSHLKIQAWHPKV